MRLNVLVVPVRSMIIKINQLEEEAHQDRDTRKCVTEIWTMLSRFRSQRGKESQQTRRDHQHVTVRTCQNFELMIKVQFVDMCLSNANRKLLISYLSHDQNLSQDLRDIQTRLQLAYTLESFDDDFTSPTPQAAGLGVRYHQVGYHLVSLIWTVR